MMRVTPDQAPTRATPAGEGMTVAQAAARIGCAEPYVRKLLSNGTLSAVEQTDVPGRPELLRLTTASVDAAVAAEHVRERQRRAYQVPYDPTWHAVPTASEHPSRYPVNDATSSPDSGRSWSEQFDSGMRWVGVPVLMLFLVTIAVLQMPGAWAAQHGRG